MTAWPVHAAWKGPIVMIGFGSIGRGTLPLILRHIDCDRKAITVIDPDDSNRHRVEKEGIAFCQGGSDQAKSQVAAITPSSRRLRPSLHRQPLGRCVLARRPEARASGGRTLTSIPSSSRGPASISTASSAARRVRTTRCVKSCWPSSHAIPAATRPSPAAEPIRAW